MRGIEFAIHCDEHAAFEFREAAEESFEGSLVVAAESDVSGRLQSDMRSMREHPSKDIGGQEQSDDLLASAIVAETLVSGSE